MLNQARSGLPLVFTSKRSSLQLTEKSDETLNCSVCFLLIFSIIEIHPYDYYDGRYYLPISRFLNGPLRVVARELTIQPSAFDWLIYAIKKNLATGFALLYLIPGLVKCFMTSEINQTINMAMFVILLTLQNSSKR